LVVLGVFMSIVKVTRKGQITIPKDIRNQLSIKEGDYLKVSLKKDKIIIEKLRPPEPGEPVGEEKYRGIIRELEEMRSKWL